MGQNRDNRVIVFLRLTESGLLKTRTLGAWRAKKRKAVHFVEGKRLSLSEASGGEKRVGTRYKS